jgi:hypothetical protein
LNGSAQGRSSNMATLSVSAPTPQFVTVGQVPMLRSHIMAAVAPMRRQVKRPKKTGGF